MRLIRAGLAALLALLMPWAAAQVPGQPIPVPKLSARVMDSTGTLDAGARNALEAKLRAFEEAKGSQVVVLVVPTVGPETVEEFAGRVADTWQLGRKGVDDGVLFLVAMQERKLRIQTGRGVQGTLTDAASKRIVADVVAPRFRSGDFTRGVAEGVDAILKAIEGEQLPPRGQRSASHKPAQSASYSDFFVLAFFAVPVVAAVLRGMFGRFFGGALTSGLAGLAGWLVFGSLVIGALAAVAAFFFALFAGSGLLRGVRSGGWGGGGGGFGGFGGGGGGGGGFSGGGGGFDGGGASGGW